MGAVADCGRPFFGRRIAKSGRFACHAAARHGMEAGMIRLFLAALLALAFSGPALSGPAFANELEATWALRIDDANIFVFVVDRADDGTWSGTWKRPGSFASNGVVFARMNGSEEVTSISGREFAGDVELNFDDPRPGAVPDVFRFRLIGPGRAQLTYVGTPLPTYPLVAVAEGSCLGPFDMERIYDRDNAVTVLPAAAAPSPAPVAGPAVTAPHAPAIAAVPVAVDAAPPVIRAAPANPVAAPSQVPAVRAVTPAAAPAAAPAHAEPGGLGDDFLDDL